MSKTLPFVFACLLITGVQWLQGEDTQDIPPGWIEHRAAHTSPSAAYQWVNVMLEASARSPTRHGARPPITSREMAIAVTSMFDAWTAYDSRAVGTRFGDKLRRPPSERTQTNKEIAIGYAMFRALQYLYPEDSAWLEAEMRRMGHDPADKTKDLSKPQGVGNIAAAAVIEYRRRDGANQHGDEVGSDGKPYSDYTFYEPRNGPSSVVDPNRWQPLPFADGKGGTFYPGFIAPHWYRVKPFALERSDQFRPPPFPKCGSAQLKKEVDECIALNASLTLEQKAIVEFMRDGTPLEFKLQLVRGLPTGASAHWLQFAQDVSRRDKYTLDQDVKLFFAVANTAFDAFIAAWDAKRYYDSSRPRTLIRHLYKGQKMHGYRGPCKGVSEIAAEEWHPYSPDTFITPPFPGYVSDQSAVGAACAKMLELFTGSDDLAVFERRKAGQLTENDCDVQHMQGRDGQPANDPSLRREVTLKLATFTATAEMAGISGIMAGYYIQTDNVEGLKLGRSLAQHTWPKYQAFFDGTAKFAPSDGPVSSRGK
jgi:hypothetical protein